MDLKKTNIIKVLNARKYPHCRCPYDFIMNDKKFVIMITQISSDRCRECESYNGESAHGNTVLVLCCGYQDYKYMWE